MLATLFLWGLENLENLEGLERLENLDSLYPLDRLDYFTSAPVAVYVSPLRMMRS